MKVYITSTPEYSKENINSVVEVLKQVPGVLEFFGGEPLRLDDIIQINQKFENPEGIKSLSFDELYALGRLYRVGKPIQRDDFVVLLTTIPNDKEWFSAFSGKNIFVDVNGWDYITESDGKYSIAYQVVENIFQSLSGIDINDVDNEPNIHGVSKGCINDMNGLRKEDVAIKLRQGYICPSCRRRARANGVKGNIILHIYNLINHLRTGLTDFESILAEVEPDPVKVDKKGKITIGPKEIKLNFLCKTLFIFFLKQQNGVSTILLKDYEDQFYQIYLKVRPSGQKKVIDNLCSDKEDGNTFEKNRTDLNKALVKQLGKRVSEFYVIDNFDVDGQREYKVKLSPDYRNIDPRF